MKNVVLSFLLLIALSSNLVSFDVSKKEEGLGLNLDQLMKSAQMLYNVRLRILDKKKNFQKYMSQHDSYKKNRVFISKYNFLLNEEWKIMHNINLLRRESIKYGYDFVIPGKKETKVRYFKYIKKNLTLDSKDLAGSEKKIKKELQENVNSLINFLVIWQYDMIARKDHNGIIHIYRKKENKEWGPLDGPNYLDYFHEWRIPAVFFNFEILEGKRVFVKVYYNNETNILKIWKNEE